MHLDWAVNKDCQGKYEFGNPSSPSIEAAEYLEVLLWDMLLGTTCIVMIIVDL